jgi:hypothetical protein
MELPTEYWDNYGLRILAKNNSNILAKLARFNDRQLKASDRDKLDKLFQELAEVARNLKLRIR